MSQKDFIEKLIDVHRRRKEQLELRVATYGISAEPGDLLEIEEISQKIEGLKKELEEDIESVRTIPLKIEEFIDRSAALDLIRPKLGELKRGQRIDQFILIIRGVPGIGKTTLLQKIREEAKAQKIDTILLDYDFDVATQDDKLYLPQAIAENFFNRNADWQNVLQAYQANKDDATQAAFYQNNLIRSFVENWGARLYEIPLLLMIDNSHHISESTKQTIEKILDSVFDYNRLFIIVAGRGDFRWNSKRFRNRTYSLTLDCFNELETAQLVAEPVNANLTKRIYWLTKGYPLACKEAYIWVNAYLKPSSPDLPNQLKTKEHELISRLVDLLSENHILSHISDFNTRKRLGLLIKIVSPLRRLEQDLLSDLSQKIDVFPFRINALEARGDISNLIRLTHLTKWESSKQDYSLDLPIRRLLMLELEIRDRKHLLKIHQFVMEWYKKKLDEMVAQGVVTPYYLIEYIFHFTQFQKISGKQYDLETEIKKRIDAQFKDNEIEISNGFREEFARDTELAELLGEVYDRLIDFVAGRDEIGT